MLTIEIGRIKAGWCAWIEHEDGTEERLGPYNTKTMCCMSVVTVLKKKCLVNVLSSLW